MNTIAAIILWLLAPLQGLLSYASSWLQKINTHAWVLTIPFRVFMMVVQCILCVQTVFLFYMLSRAALGFICIQLIHFVDYVDDHPSSNTVASVLVRLSWPTL